MRLRALWLVTAAVAAVPAAARADDARPDIVVVATPLGGEAQSVADADELRASRATNLGEQLARTALGVNINETQDTRCSQSSSTFYSPGAPRAIEVGARLRF